MKRYSMRAYENDGIFYKSYEDVLGEWVKWEDINVMTRCNLDLMDENRKLQVDIRDLESELDLMDKRLLTTAIIGKDGVLEVRDITICNCKKELNAMKNGWKFETIGDDIVLTNSWICPAHGYKKR